MFNFSRIDLKDQPFELLLQEISGLPAGTGGKMVVVKNFPLKPESLNNQEPLLRQLLDVLKDKNHPVVSVFIFPEIKKIALEAHPLYQLALREGEFLELAWFTRKDTAELINLIKDLVQAAGKKISPEALEKLASFNEWQPASLYGEVEKLITYAGDNPQITAAMVTEVVSEKTKKIFALTDSLGTSDAVETLKILNALLREGESADSLIPFLARHFRLLLNIKALSLAGLGKRQIIDRLIGQKYNYYAIINNYDRALAGNVENLLKTISLLHQFDLAIKTGRTESNLGAEILLTELSQKQ
jgi:DNA polymerase-3 subunit delta